MLKQKVFHLESILHLHKNSSFNTKNVYSFNGSVTNQANWNLTEQQQ